MKVLNLECGQHHVFEGWFASEDDFQSQLSRSLVTCPLCDDTRIIKRLSAPRLNLGVSRTPDGADAESEESVAVSGPATDAVATAQRAWLGLVREVIARTEDVGERFPEVARQMHYGETDARGIRGKATPAQAQALVEEGIDVIQMPVPSALKESLQ